MFRAYQRTGYIIITHGDYIAFIDNEDISALKLNRTTIISLINAHYVKDRSWLYLLEYCQTHIQLGVKNVATGAVGEFRMNFAPEIVKYVEHSEQVNRLNEQIAQMEQLIADLKVAESNRDDAAKLIDKKTIELLNL